MSESVLVTWERDVQSAHMHMFGNVRRQNRETYRYANGSVVVVGGLDRPERTYSAEYDTVTVFESTECTENDIEQLLRALRSGRMPWQQLVCDCNPAAERHWLNVRAEQGWFRRIVTRIADNPRFMRDGVLTEDGRRFMQSVEALTGHRRARLLDGRWCSAEGVVYDEFDAAVHVVDALPDGWQAWRKYRAIDFGFNDPFVCLWFADDGESLWMYREVYMSGRLVEDHARTIVALSGDEQYEFTVADHDREDRETLHRHGVKTVPAQKDIDAGLDAVRSRIRVRPNGRPGLYVLRSALVERDRRLEQSRRPTSTRDEFDAYVWATRRDGAVRDMPMDRDNHGMDALRYVVMGVDCNATGGTYIGVVEW
jgi:phage terminase large subunit